MAYIGNQPTDNFVNFATQNFSTSATSSYTLSHAVSNESEIALFINNVRQHPGSGKAYTATGTTLVDADRLVANDAGTMVQVAMSDVKTYLSSAGFSTDDPTALAIALG